MEQGKSHLNPDAAPYIPIDKQEGTEPRNKFSEVTTEGSPKSDGDVTAARPFSPTEGHCSFGPGKSSQAAPSDLNVHGIGFHLFDSEVSGEHYENLKSTDQIEMHYMDEASQIDIDHLAFLFPDISVKFLANVYSLSGGDLDDSVDMLKDLEGNHAFAVPKNLPHSSDTGDDSGKKVVAEGSYPLKS